MKEFPEYTPATPIPEELKTTYAQSVSEFHQEMQAQLDIEAEMLQQRKVEIDGYITVVFENALAQLHAARLQIDRVRGHGAGDVNEINRIPLLDGITTSINYRDLLAIETVIRNGLAGRRAAAAS